MNCPGSNGNRARPGNTWKNMCDASFPSERIIRSFIRTRSFGRLITCPAAIRMCPIMENGHGWAILKITAGAWEFSTQASMCRRTQKERSMTILSTWPTICTGFPMNSHFRSCGQTGLDHCPGYGNRRYRWDPCGGQRRAPYRSAHCDRFRADHTGVAGTDKAEREKRAEGTEKTGRSRGRMKAWNHFCTITEHKIMVMRHCFKIGLYRQGLLHDMSKYTPRNLYRAVNTIRATEAPIMPNGRTRAIQRPGFTIRAATSTITSTGLITA